MNTQWIYQENYYDPLLRLQHRSASLSTLAMATDSHGGRHGDGLTKHWDLMAMGWDGYVIFICHMICFIYIDIMDIPLPWVYINGTFNLITG